MTRQVDDVINGKADAYHSPYALAGAQLPIHNRYDCHDINDDKGDWYNCIYGNDYVLRDAEHGNESKANGDDHTLLHCLDELDLHDNEAPVESCRLYRFVNPFWCICIETIEYCIPL